MALERIEMSPSVLAVDPGCMPLFTWRTALPAVPPAYWRFIRTGLALDWHRSGPPALTPALTELQCPCPEEGSIDGRQYESRYPARGPGGRSAAGRRRTGDRRPVRG